MEKNEEEVYDLLNEHDFKFVRHTKHGKLYGVGAARIVVPGTPGDRRSFANTLRDLKRELRTHGLLKEETPVANPEIENYLPARARLNLTLEQGVTKVIKETPYSFKLTLYELNTLIKPEGVEVSTEAKVELINGVLVFSWSEISEETVDAPK